DDDGAAGHIFAAMIAGALDHRGRARVADGEALAGDPGEIGLAAGRSIEAGVADDDVVRGDSRRALRLADDEGPARQALAGIVVAVADQLERDSRGEIGAEALPRRAGQADVDRAVGQPVRAVAAGDLAGEPGADRAVLVA